MESKRSKSGNGKKHLASINFPAELLTYLDGLAMELDMNRSSLVCLILQDFKDAGRAIKIQVIDKE